jgi:hypothetical protein
MTSREFFERYASRSLGDHPEELATLYASTFIVASPQGSQAFTNDARFLEWLRQVAAFNREHGMRSLTAVALAETMLSPRHVLVIVTWGAQFEKTGKRVIEFQISYLLEKDSEEWRILAYVSEADQEDEMRKAGLL